MSKNAPPSRSTNGPVLTCRGVRKTYQQGRIEVPVLLGVDLDVARAERVAIVGASGSGKSTLLHLLGGLDEPTAGDIRVLGRDLVRQSEAERGHTRNHALGFVYQFHHLLPEFTALENVAMPLFIRRTPVEEAKRAATEVLEKVGLAHRLHHTPAELSGGERQRVALARALIDKPALLLLDEPFAALDPLLRIRMRQELLNTQWLFGVPMLIITHDPQDVAALAEGVVILAHGRVARSVDLKGPPYRDGQGVPVRGMIRRLLLDIYGSESDRSLEEAHE